jgi:hypothetical protein
MEQVNKLAEASKVRERSPETFKAFVDQVTNDGVRPTELYIDAQQLANTLNQSGISMEQLQALAPTVAEQLQPQNIVPGADIRIPVADLMTAPAEISTPLIDHLRASPDAMSRSEAGTYLEQQGEQLRTEVEKQLSRQDDRAAFQQQVDQLRDGFQAQLDQAGKFRPEVNRAYATLLGNFYATQAARAGIPLADFVQKYQLQVTGKDALPGRQRYDQGPGEPTDGRPERPDGSGLRGDEDLLPTVGGGSPARGWAGATRASRDGRPVVVHRGAAVALSPEHFDVANLGKASGNPSSGLGVWFTPSRGEASRYGSTESFHLDLRNPKVVRVEDLPAFDSVAEANAWREQQRAAGFDGLIVTAKHLGGPVHMVAFDPQQVIYPASRKQVNQGERGALSFSEDITQAPSVIALLEGADLSTFIHESGHFFLEVQADLAARIAGKIAAGEEVAPGEQQIVEDMNSLLKWFGIEGTPSTSPLAEWQAMSMEEKREHHESFARGFEHYAMEGKAPSQGLQEVFQRFRAWLISVYKTLAGLNVKLTDDVRAVMDRMIATEDAIQQAQDARAMGPLFESAEQAGMTPEQYAEYHGLAEQATAIAQDQLGERVQKDLKWMSSARDKALKARQKEVAGLRSEVRAEVSREVMAQPVYQAWQFLTGKGEKIKPGTRTEESIDTVQESGRLRTALVKETDPAAAETLIKRRMTHENEGMHPDIVGELFGYESGAALIQALATAEAPSVAIDQLTDQRMLERYGDIASAQAMQRAAEEAIHNEVRARVIAAELKALQRATTVRGEGDNSLYSRSTVDVLARAAKEYAQGVVARLQLKNVRPQQYTAAEARSAKLAMQSLGNVQEAAMHKQNQLVNNYAAKAAFEAQAEIIAANQFFKKVTSQPISKVAETRDAGVVQAARAILAEYGIGNKGEPASKYLASLAQDDPGMYGVLQEKIAALTANAKPAGDMTVEEFRGLVEEIQGLWHMSRRSRQMEVDGQLVEIANIKDALVGRMVEVGIPAEMPGEGRAVTDRERRLAKLQTLKASLRRVESWVGLKDGADMGPFRKYVWQPVKEAADRYRADKATYIKRYKELLEKVDLGQSRIAAPELGYTFGFSRGGSGKAEILHAILHTGNESNKRKLLLGRGWATENEQTGELDTSRWDAFVQRMMDQGVLTKADFDFAQGVWDLLEDTKALAQRAHRDVFGRYFDEVTANSFTNQFGTYRGGYVPAMTDPEVVKDAATRALQEDENQTLAYAFPSTQKGFTKARVEYNRPLLLDLRTVSSHLDKVLLFSHMEQPIRDVRKVLSSKDVSEPLHRLDPAAYDSLLTPWLNRAARQTVETKVPGDNGTMRFFSKLRQRAGMAAMFANVSNTAQQITGFSLAAVKVHPKYLMDAVATYLIAPRQTAKTVGQNSIYMANRMNSEVAQMTDAIDEILLNPNVYEKAQNWTAKHAYFLQSAVDNVMGPIIWMGAYNQALERGHSTKDAQRLADSAIRETQGSTLAEDVSRFETGNAFVRIFTQFAGYFNMQANLLGTEFSKNYHELGLRKGMGRGLYIFTLGFLVPNMVAELVAQAFKGGPDDEDKDGSTIDDWLASVVMMGNVKAGFAMLPGVGQVINAGINTFNKKPYDDRITTSPAISMLESAVAAPMSVYKAAVSEGSLRKAVRDVATLISITTGLPATAIARPLGYMTGISENTIAPTGPVDTARGLVTGTPSPESKR